MIARAGAAFTVLVHRLRPAFNTQLDAGRQALQGRTPRERAMLGAMAVVLASAGIYALLVSPLLDARAGLRAEIAALDQALANARTAAPNPIEAPVNEPAAVRVNALAAEAGVDITRLETRGARLAVSLEDAPFDAVASWIAALQRAPGLSVVDVTVERRPTPGIVSADIEIEGRGYG